MSALLGVGFLVLTVRHLVADHYGAYVALIALIDVFYLSTGLGLSTIAQRYVAEFRLRATPRRLHAFIGGLFVRRICHSLLFGALLLGLHEYVLPALGLPIQERLLPLVVILLMAAASLAMLDEVLAALLLQGSAQAMAMTRNLIKVGVVGAILLAGRNLNIDVLLVTELVAVVLAMALGYILLYRQLRRDVDAEGGDSHYEVRGMWGMAGRFYLIQLIGQAYGQNVAKLIITRMLGLAQTAAYGFAQSIADMLANYLPAHLLAGWLRPLMVSRYLARGKISDLVDVANLVLKLNLIGILPVAVFFGLYGDRFASWVTGGKYGHAGLLLMLVTLFIGLQTVHLMVAMIAMTVEQASSNLVATLMSGASLPLSLLLIHWLGTEGASLGLICSELVWIASAVYLLYRRGFPIEWDIGGSLRLCVAGVGAAIVGYLLPIVDGAPLLQLSLAAVVIGGVFLLLAVLTKPLREAERTLIRGIIPARFVIL
ncbi:polysaccharide biosynthesis C-terminal domain-containing protein [Duganella fentianensis]|uniref:lipopolysaccharide biosynthesis protein n=1 Tax=Duganella fentianensis TaxID=2692177 RepID=UPI0032B1EA03